MTVKVYNVGTAHLYSNVPDQGPLLPCVKDQDGGAVLLVPPSRLPVRPFNPPLVLVYSRA